ncbi:MAG: ABC transporter permease subunit [Anaerolineales bacterium]|nr:ABC transporter permease subunit [Anaerolineales bacterium]
MKLKWKQVTGLLFATPAIIYFLVFFIFPFLFNLYLSFQKWDLLSPMEYVGLDNFVRMGKDPILQKSVFNTFYYVFGAAIPIWILSLAYALWFNNRFRGKQIYVVIFLMACLMGLVPSLMAWRLLLHQQYGLFNKIFIYSWTGLDTVNWLQNPRLAMPGIIITSLSTGIPFYAIYLIGAVASIPDEYFEVAKLEGANFFHRLWYIILPTIKPVYLFVIIVTIISGFQYLGPFYILTNGGPVDSTRVISLHIWNNAFYFNKFGYSAALTLGLLAILIPITYVSLRLGGES